MKLSPHRIDALTGDDSGRVASDALQPPYGSAHALFGRVDIVSSGVTNLGQPAVTQV
jgi:hypothetical protein